MASWQSGTLYNPGTIVSPATAAPVGPSPPTNADFDDGDTGWDKETGWSIVAEGTAFTGTYAAKFDLNGSSGEIRNQNHVPVTPGKVINARCAIIATGNAHCAIRVFWFDATDTEIGSNQGNIITATAPAWFNSAVYAVAPANAAYACVGASATDVGGGGPTAAYVDNVTWDYAYATPPDGLVFKAVQTNAGYSDVDEPTWPTTAGDTVVDNEVTWEALIASSVVWEAVPILKSSGAEPTWPTIINGTVPDGTVLWEATAGQITDEKCPNSEVVAIAASKVYAVDQDIIAYCATVNPLDWSSADDAGYLPFGLQTYGSNPASALGLYRSNLVALNSGGMQMWQVDQDPTNMALLDAIPIGCTYPKSVQPVMNDMVLVTNQGIRSIGIAAASTNLQAGDFGKQIDPLVKEALATDATPIGLYVPALGQYWAIFGAEAFVLTTNGSGTDSMSWSRYVFSEAITDWTLYGDDLYLRTVNNRIWKVTEESLVDDAEVDEAVGGTDTEFQGEVWWHYLDLGPLGQTEMLHGFDIVCTGEVAVSFGFNQTNPLHVTAGYTIDGDSLPGTVVPIPLAAPSIQPRLTFAGNQEWELSAVCLYVQDLRKGS